MFRNVVGENPLVNSAANNFFSHISGDTYRSDWSFLATLRALIAPRMAEGERLTLRFGISSYSESTVASTPVKRMVGSICSNMLVNEPGEIYVHNFSGGQENNLANIELLKSSFCDKYPGWERIEKVTDFFRKQFNVLCFVNKELKSVAIFGDSLDLRKMHYLQCAIFAFFPWYFDPSKGVSEIEMRLIESLREKNPNKYIETLAEIAKQFDFRSANIKRLLKGFETRYERIEKERIRRAISDKENDIDRVNSEIVTMINSLNDMRIKLLGLELKIESDGETSEIMDYFLCNKKLELVRVNDTKMRFTVKDYATYFDEEMASNTIANINSYVYKPGGRDRSDEIAPAQIKKLMRAIFVKQELKMKLCAAYEFDLRAGVNGITGYEFGAEFNDCMPNMHIQKHACLGNYREQINNRLKKRDYIGAIELCVASCKSLNFADTTVMTKVMNAIYGSDVDNNRCIELPDGNIVTPKEAITWLEEKEREGEASE